MQGQKNQALWSLWIANLSDGVKHLMEQRLRLQDTLPLA